MGITLINRILLFLPLLLQLLGLFVAVWADHYITREQRVTLLLINLLILALVVQNYIDYYLAVNLPYNISARTAVSVAGYVMRPLILVLFIGLTDPSRRSPKPLWFLVWVNTGVYVTAFFSGIAFYFRADGAFMRGPLGYTCHVISLMLLAVLFYVSVRNYQAERKRETAIPIVVAAMIVGGVVMDMVLDFSYYMSFLTVTVVCGSLFYYLWLHLQYVRLYEQSIRTEQRIRIMMSQIQPHFLFNTLSTIQALCLLDPEKASSTTEKFGTYLRQNLDSLRQPDLIPFEKELEHTKIYTDIEMIRFPRIRVVFDISDSNFELPALTVQPLVENAIRHGIRIRENGLVSVQVFKAERGGHEIIIRDNGKGFDVESALKSDETHIGLRNVKDRVEQMCGGTMIIESEPDKGATITIYIPEKIETEE